MLDTLSDPKLAIILAVLFSKFKSSTYHFPFIGIVFNLMGTFLHELAHFVVALILNGRPVGFSLLPKRYGTGWILGSVEVSNARWYNALPIAMAPLSLFLGAYFLDVWYNSMFIVKTLWRDLTYLMVLVILVENAIPSIQDFKVAFSNIFGVLFFSAIASYFLLPLAIR
jgi:hypothetical protein